MSLTLTVVMPVYNGSRFIEAAIDSILNQTSHPFDVEIIAVNDGSTDDSSLRLKSLQQNCTNLTVISHKKNKGIAAARNTGINASSGEWLSFIDQDDRWEVNKLSIQYEYLQKNKHIDFVVAHQAMHLEKNIEKPSWVKSEWLSTPQIGYLLGCLLIKKSDFLRVGSLNDEWLDGNDDVQWFVDARQAGLTHAVMPQVLINRSVHLNNASQRTMRNNKALLETFRSKIKTSVVSPRFSVIMPMYNAGKTVWQALESLLNQLSDKDEIFVIDDNSIDDSVEKVLSIEDKRIRLIRNDTNRGISAARNRAIGIVNGDYIAFLDADDVWAEGRHSAVLAAVAKDKPDVISGMIEHFYCPSLTAEQKSLYLLPETQHATTAGSAIFSSGCVKTAGEFDESLRVGEFIDWISRMNMNTEKWTKLECVVLRRRIHGHNTTLLNKHKQDDYLTVMRRHLARQV